MLASYYSKNADFKSLFDKLEISKSESYYKHLNKHSIIYITLNQNSSLNCTYEEFIGRYVSLLCQDSSKIHTDLEINENWYTYANM